MTNSIAADDSETVTADREAPRAPLIWSAPVARLSVALGGTVFRHVSTEQDVGITLSNRFEMFRVPDSFAADCTVRWFRGVVEPSYGEVMQRTEIWEARRQGDGRECTVFVSGDRRRPYLSLTFEPDFRAATIVHELEASARGFVPELHPLSEYLTSRVLTWAGRVEVHASAAVAGGRALLFVGHSGAGKTTMSIIAGKAGALVLSDDRVILGMHGGRPLVWGTPWHGSGWFTSADSSELGGVFLLRHGEETRVIPLSYAETIKHLFVRAIQVRARADEVLQTHAVLEEILAVVPAFEFTFQPTVSAFAIAERAANGQATP